MRRPSLFLLASLLPLMQATTVLAQAPEKLPANAGQHAHEASPDVYRLLEENQHFRVILAVWKPGQSDQWHSHADELANYTLTDCQLKGLLPDGKVGELMRKKGTVGFNSKSTHKVTNTGSGECVLLIVERK